MLWLAHALTLSRIPIGVALAFAYGDARWSVALILVAALTDTLDGNLARALQRRGHTSPAIGGWLDPLMDKVFVAIVLVVIWIRSGDLFVIAAIGARELVLVPLVAVYLARHRPVRELRADTLGKVATVAQFLAVALVIGVPAWAVPVAVITGVLGLAAAGHYVVKELRGSVAPAHAPGHPVDAVGRIHR
ncbi:MAG: CDP-alcohol phosphatidyltransferase family protein [Deltaproteobacteria bacterium]|nr:CDP-alcohol phosphatidyltransferase family protein [Deltaproteobacteria bacterium]